MTSKHVRVKVHTPSPSSAATNPATTKTTSHRSRCTHCRDRQPHQAPRIAGPDPPYKSGTRDAVETPRPIADAITLNHSPDPRLPPSLPVAPSIPLAHHMFAGPGPIPVHLPHEPRLHPFAPAPVLHHLGRGPEPLFGWESVMPLPHTYGHPKYLRRTKPDYRRFCFSVGKADVPFAAMPGGPLRGMDVTMAPQIVGSHRW